MPKQVKHPQPQCLFVVNSNTVFLSKPKYQICYPCLNNALKLTSKYEISKQGLILANFEVDVRYWACLGKPRPKYEISNLSQNILLSIKYHNASSIYDKIQVIRPTKGEYKDVFEDISFLFGRPNYYISANSCPNSDSVLTPAKVEVSKVRALKICFIKII